MSKNSECCLFTEVNGGVLKVSFYQRLGLAVKYGVNVVKNGELSIKSEC